jgi:hypothetical protein
LVLMDLYQAFPGRCCDFGDSFTLAKKEKGPTNWGFGERRFENRKGIRSENTTSQMMQMASVKHKSQEAYPTTISRRI